MPVVSGPFNAIYPCPNIRTEERDVYINAGPSSPMRAPGWPQGMFALELAMDELARKLKLDRLEFRRRNNINPVRAAEFDLGAQRLRMGREKPRRPKSSDGAPGSRRGIGGRRMRMAQPGRLRSAGDRRGWRDGRFEVRVGTQDIGTGTRTVLAMVAAEESGCRLAR